MTRFSLICFVDIVCKYLPLRRTSGFDNADRLRRVARNWVTGNVIIKSSPTWKTPFPLSILNQDIRERYECRHDEASEKERWIQRRWKGGSISTHFWMRMSEFKIAISFKLIQQGGWRRGRKGGLSLIYSQSQTQIIVCGISRCQTCRTKLEVLAVVLATSPSSRGNSDAKKVDPKSYN